MSLSLFLNYYLLPGIVDHGNKVSDTSEAPCDTAEVNNICFNGSLEDVKEANLIQAPSSDSTTSSFLIESNSPSNVKFDICWHKVGCILFERYMVPSMPCGKS